MARGKKEKIAVIVLTPIIIALSFFPELAQWGGLYAHCPLLNRISYHFIHAGILHAATNCWCLLSLVFAYSVSWRSLAVAFIIASTFPSYFIQNGITVGLSGVCFSMFGLIIFKVKRKTYFQLCICFYILMGFLFPNVASWLHLYCYVVALAVSVLNVPLIKS